MVVVVVAAAVVVVVAAGQAVSKRLPSDEARTNKVNIGTINLPSHRRR